jgi:hypothetical protein
MLQLKGYDVILGADWIYHQSPVTLDYKRMTLKATTESGEIVTFQDESLPLSASIQETYSINKLLLQATCGAMLFIRPVDNKDTSQVPQPPSIQQLLDTYSALFSEPTQLPPHRECDHTIPLLRDAKIVNQRPYRLSHQHKNVLEDIVKDLLLKGVIRDSSSPYSSPVVLFKKKDNTWR